MSHSIPLRTLLASASAFVVLMIGAAAAPRAEAAPQNFYGVVQQGPFLNSDFPLMASGGVGTIRMLMQWQIIEPNPGDCTPAGGSCNWGHVDPVVGPAAANGIEVFPFLYTVPRWISKQPRNAPKNKSDLDAWADFAQAAGQRYGPGGFYWRNVYPFRFPGRQPVPITNYQIWNEPNSGAFWRKRPNPKQYMKLVKTSWKAIKKDGVKQNKIVLGGLFGTPGGDRPSMTSSKFLKGVYKTKRAEKYFDAISLFPYGPDLRAVNTQMKWGAKAVKKGGDKNVRVWVSELGWADRGPKNTNAGDLVKGAKGQAKLLTKSFKLLKKNRKRWNVAGIQWFSFQDGSKKSGFCGWCKHSGLVKFNRKPKPAWKAFKKIAR